MLLAVSFLAASLVFGATAPTPTATPTVPPTATPTLTPSVAPTATLTPTVEASPTRPATPTLGLPPTPTTAPTRAAVSQPAADAGLPASQLPPTAPGLSRNEGTFLVAAADDGSRAVYFIAGNSRHSVLTADLQLEMQLNPLWPIRQVSREEVLAFVEGAPVGHARAGLLSGPAPVADTQSVEGSTAEQPVVQTFAQQPVIAQPTVEQSVVVQPIVEQPIVEQSVVEQPVAQPSVVEQPVVQQPVAQPSYAEQPVAQPSVAEPPAAETPVTDAPYVLQPGDNLTRIAERYHTSINAILMANHLTNANLIYVGKTLVIPTGSEPPALALELPAPVADTPPGARATTTYTVRAGDSAIGIARQFGVEVEALLAANRVADRNRVYVGQVLTIPSSEA